jgi:hypothetical protein
MFLPEVDHSESPAFSFILRLIGLAEENVGKNFPKIQQGKLLGLI